VNASKVNWLPWAVLNVSGAPKRCKASSRASMLKVRIQGVRYPPREHTARMPVHDSYQVHEAARHRDVGDVGRPHLIRAVNHQVLEQIRINPVRLGGQREIALRIQRDKAHRVHQTLYALAIDPMPLIGKPVPDAPAAVVGMFQMATVDQLHKLKLLLGYRLRHVIKLERGRSRSSHWRVTGNGSVRSTISFLWARESVRERILKNRSPSSADQSSRAVPGRLPRHPLPSWRPCRKHPARRLEAATSTA
jgi:hypothetical protein